MTIKAILIFEEKEPRKVNTTIEIPANDGSSTDAENNMMITYLAFNNIISEPKYFDQLGAMLIPEINRIIKEMEEENARRNNNQV